MKSLDLFSYSIAAAFLLASCDKTPSTAQNPSSSSPGQNWTAAGVTLTASPNPVPSGSDPGTTTIAWNSGGKASAAVYVSIDGGEEKLFGTAPEGTSEAPWIQPDMTYEFRLYASVERKELLGRLSVAHAK